MKHEATSIVNRKGRKYFHIKQGLMIGSSTFLRHFEPASVLICQLAHFCS